MDCENVSLPGSVTTGGESAKSAGVTLQKKALSSKARCHSPQNPNDPKVRVGHFW
jgi:hypothetical protein